MASIDFEWDPGKERQNRRKHRVGFDEARSVFLDPAATQFFDDAHAEDEDRFLMLGLSASLRLLLVVHAVREAGDTTSIRIISARKATPGEAAHYGEGELPARLRELTATTYTAHPSHEDAAMKAEYDLASMRSRPNPYASRLKKQITIRLGEDVLEYFKRLAEQTGMGYQSLIDLYLRDCMTQGRRPEIVWSNAG